jgi:polar amino acid transport system substrate-binding protein
VKAIEGEQYDLALIDWHLFRQAQSQIPKQPQRSYEDMNIPTIITIDAKSRDQVIRPAYQMGLEGFLTKPLDPSKLAFILQTTLERYASEMDTVSVIEDRLQERLYFVRGAHILLVEDNDINQQLARELLEEAGFVVTTADNGREAVQAVENASFDAVLMDVQMPVMDGYQATREIRNLGNLQHLPIVAMTSHAMTGDREKSLEAGMNDHITKPINPRQLISVLLSWIQPGKCEKTKDLPDKRELKKVFVDRGLGFYLPGIDTQKGLARAAGNEALYHNLLKKFYRDNADIGNKIRHSWEQGDHELAQRLVHTVKGVAGNIGAVDLENATAALEAAIRQPLPEEFENLLHRFDRCLKSVMASLHLAISNDFKKQPATAGKTAPKGGKDRLQNLLRQLEPYVKDREAKPCKAIARQIARYRWPREYKKDIGEMNQSLEKYRFKQAQALLTGLLDRLE